MTRFLMGLFALLVCAPGVGLAFDWSTEPDLRAACRLMEREGDLPPWWVDVCGEPIPPVSPDLPPMTEDDGEEPPLPPSGCWTTPSGQRLCPGEDGREVVDHSEHGGIILVDLWPEWQEPREGDRPPVTSVSDLLHAWGMYATEDGVDDPTPTLDDPTEKLLEQIGWRGGSPLGTEDEDPTPDETPTAAPVEATPEPTPAACPPNTTPAFGGLFCLGYWTPGGDWREVEGGGTPCGQEGEPACPGAPHPQPDPCESGTRPCASGCCWPIGHTPDGDDGGWDAPLPREVPADYEGPWRR